MEPGKWRGAKQKLLPGFKATASANPSFESKLHYFYMISWNQLKTSWKYSIFLIHMFSSRRS